MKIVAITGYTVQQIVLSVILVYLLFVILFLAVWIDYILAKEQGSTRKPLAFVAVGVGIVVVTVVFMLPARIGTVMFLDGVLCTMIVGRWWEIFLKFRVRVGEDGQTDS